MPRRFLEALRCIATAAVFLGAAHPANAQITGVTLSANQPSFTGDCPTTVSFSGVITGKPGTGFWFTFIWQSGQNTVFSGDSVVTMPPSGSLPVQHSISVSASTTGGMEVRVSHISSGQPDMYDTAAYSVTCKFNPQVRPSNARLGKTVTLHPQWFGLREYEYKTVGPFSSFVPERGSAPCKDLCVGWDHILDGAFLWLFHWNTYDRAFWGYDPGAFTGLKVKKATVTLKIDGGDPACFGGLGRAVLTRTHVVPGTTQTFEAPYPDDGDFRWPAPVHFDAGSATIDVTSIVQAWVGGKMVNQGFVIRGRLEDNGAESNDGCSLSFGTDAVLAIEE